MKNRNLIHIIILVLTASGIGIYLVQTTVLISKDGTTFIEYARNFAASPAVTVLSSDQHPGYPLLILSAHKIAGITGSSTSLRSWIYSAQIVTLLFRVLAIAVIYFVGKEIVGEKFSFLGVLILIVLPKPAEYGSDALSDWPHMFFFAAGFLMLLRGATYGKWRFFAFAGLAAGLGYLIRPECAQIVVLGFCWLGLQLFWPKRFISRRNAVIALVLLFAGFLSVSGPYMKLKGAVFPKKHIGSFASKVQSSVTDEKQTPIPQNFAGFKAVTLLNIVKAFGVMAENISDVLMWFFVPALLVGLYQYFNSQDWIDPKKFFTLFLIMTSVPVLTWLYCKYGYIDERHTFPMVVLTIFFIPMGLQAIAGFLQRSFAMRNAEAAGLQPAREIWFLALFIIGISICVPKLFTFLHSDKKSYLKAAQWLVQNTNEKDLIAVPDLRISFYAQRQGLKYEGGNIPGNAVYTVRLQKHHDEEPLLSEAPGKIEYKYIDKRKNGVDVAIYRNF